MINKFLQVPLMRVVGMVLVFCCTMFLDGSYRASRGSSVQKGGSVRIVEVKEKGPMCCICQEVYTKDMLKKRTIVQFDCGTTTDHFFCLSCIKPWVVDKCQTTCPICRAQFTLFEPYIYHRQTRGERALLAALKRKISLSSKTRPAPITIKKPKIRKKSTLERPKHKKRVTRTSNSFLQGIGGEALVGFMLGLLISPEFRPSEKKKKRPFLRKLLYIPLAFVGYSSLKSYNPQRRFGLDQAVAWGLGTAAGIFLGSNKAEK